MSFYFLKMNIFQDWLTKAPNCSRFKSDKDKKELQRYLTQIDGCLVGIGKTGLYRTSYSFAAANKLVSNGLKFYA